MIELWTLENEIYAGGVKRLCGVDEAGRGPLAGPVCAAAVILPQNCEIEGLNDSKKLTEKKREARFDLICAAAVSKIAMSIVRRIAIISVNSTLPGPKI